MRLSCHLSVMDPRCAGARVAPDRQRLADLP